MRTPDRKVEPLIGELTPRARLVRAFLLAPLAAPAVYSGALLGGELVSAGSLPSGGSALGLVAGIFAVGAPLAYAATLLAGGPAYLLLRRLRLLRRWTVWSVAAAAGTAVALLLAPLLRGDLFSIRFHWWTGAALGLVCAEAFLRLLGPVIEEISPRDRIA